MNWKTCVLLVGLGLGFLLLTPGNASAQYYRWPAGFSVNVGGPYGGFVSVNGSGYYPHYPRPVVVTPGPYYAPRPHYHGPYWDNYRRPYRPYYPYRYR